MNTKPVFFFVLGLFFSANTFAFVNIQSSVVFPDTTAILMPSLPALSVPEQHTGLFSRLTNKLIGFVCKRPSPASPVADKKTKLGWLAIGLILLGVGLMFASSSLVPLLLATGGLVAGVKAISIKREPPVEIKQEPPVVQEEKKKTWAGRKLGWLIGLGLLVGGAVAIFIALGNLNFH